MQEFLARHGTLLGAVLIAAGLNTLTLRRHAAATALAAQVVALGAALMLGSRPGHARLELALALLAGAACVALVGLAVLGRWRRLRGSADLATLQERDADHA